MQTPLPAILIIEDDADFRRGICLWLSGAGYTPIEADDGGRGLELVRRYHPEAVLLDLRLPRMDGFEVLDALQDDEDAPPVIVISGQNEITGVIRAFRMGAADYLEKPLVSFDLLEHALTGVLERVRLSRAVHLAQSRYASLVENIPLLVFVLRPDQQLDFINAYCHDMLGYSREDALDTPNWLLDRVHTEDRTRIRNLLTHPSANGLRVQTGECRLIHKNGATIHALVTAIPSPPSEKPEAPALLEGIIVDITDRVELERFVVQEEKLKTLGAIAAEVAHEIRNPLFSIAGFAHRLKVRLPDSHEADIILAESRRLEDILDRIGNYLHPVDLRPRLCSLGAIVGTTLDFLAPELSAKGVHMQTRLADNVPPLHLDPDLLCQVVASLIRFTIAPLPRGATARIEVSRGQRFAHLDVVAMFAAPIREPELLFLPFEEAEDRTGLPLAHRIVKNMGGTLTFEQARNGQSTFTVRLPMNDAEAPVEHM